MHQYNVYKHPLGKFEAIKQGWSWPAFFLGFLWAMYRKMWWLGYGVFAGFIVLTFITYSPNNGPFGSPLYNIISFASMFVYGALGNQWLQSSLTSRGFDLVDTIHADTPDGAIANYLKHGTSATDDQESIFNKRGI